jgi:hypothetical protein
MSSYLQLCQRVRQEAAISGAGPSAVTGQTGQYAAIVTWVARAWLEIQNENTNWNFLWDELSFDTIDGTQDYTPQKNSETPKRFSEDMHVYTKALGTDDSAWLKKLDWAKFKDTYATGVKEKGRPKYFAYKPNGAITFYPIPNDAFTVTVDFYRPPQVLAANTDVPLIPSEFEDAIIYKALMYWAEYSDAREVYQGSSANYERVMNRMTEEQLERMTIDPTPLATTNRQG